MTSRRKVFISAISGNILEYYDFTVYAVFTVTIGRVFFPDHSEFAQIIYSLGVFALGFLTRPIGGVLFGYIADRYGRRNSLITSMIGMTISTFVIGLIPDYSVINFYAPLILIIMRLFQGLCISGEGAGAAIFILEHHGNFRPGFTAGVVQASNIVGTLLAALVALLFSYFFPEIEYAWRLAFIIGGVMGLVGFYLRLRVSETPIFIALAEKKQTLKSPFFNVLKHAPLSVLVTFTLGAAASSVVYLIKTYINVYYNEIMNLSDSSSQLYLIYASLIMMITMPISGYLSDLIGRFRMITLSTKCVFVLALPCFWLFTFESNFVQIVALTLLAILGGLISGSAYIFIISLFSPEQRFSGVAFSYNLGIALFGGTAAAISRSLVEVTGCIIAPAFYIMFTTSMFLIVVLSTKDKLIKILNSNNV